MQITFRRLKLATALFLATAAALPAVAAPPPTSGPTSTVVYVSGNDVVLKASDGKLLNFVVPAGYKFTVGGAATDISGLKPGTTITAPVVTGVDPQYVSSVTIAKATVSDVAPPSSVTLLLPDGEKEFTVPAGTLFVVDGKTIGIADVKRGMAIDATIVTPGIGMAGVATPSMTGALLVAKLDSLPEAGTNLPLYGFAGLAMLLAGFAMLSFRKPVAVRNR